jgi:glycosyltransferase involved in cell wall biosynthesis
VTTRPIARAAVTAPASDAPPGPASRPGSDRLRIAVWHNLPSGGGKRALHQHVRGLVERGHVVESWRLSSADPSYLPLADVAPEHVVPFADPGAAGAGRARQFRDLLGTGERVRRMHEACAQCAREMRSRGVDVVFAASCRTFLVPFIGLHAGLPAVAYIQEPSRGLYEAAAGRTLPWVARPSGDGVAARLGRTLARGVLARRALEEWRAVHAFDRVLVNSRFSREAFLRAYGLDTRVCYLGVDAGQFAPSEGVREHFVVGLGSFNALKGVDLAVRAVALLPAPRPALAWIGNSADGPYLDAVARLAASLGVDFRQHLGASDAEVVALLGSAAAMLYTSHLEPFGFAPLEANACGTPVVAVAEGGVRETVQDGVNGCLVDDRDPAALAEALGRLLADPERARALGRRARGLVEERWTVERSVACVESHLREVAQAGAARGGRV